MRLIFISSYWPEYSGPAVRMREINKYFKEDVFIVCPNRNKRGFNFEIHKEDNYIEYILSFRSFYIIDFLIGLFISLILPNKKIVHVCGTSPFIHALFLASNLRKDIKILFELVCTDSSPVIKFKSLPIIIKPYKKSTLILPLNKGQSFKGFNFIIKPNSISEEIVVASNKKFLKYNNIKLIKNKFVYLGYLSKFMDLKNQSFLIDVMNILPKNYKLVLGGPFFDDNYFKKGISNKNYLFNLKNKIIKFNLSDRVDLKIGIIDPIDFYKKLDIYVNPSNQEGFGTTFIEAVAFGLPVVANKNIQSFRDCREFCSQTVHLESISNPEIFAKSIVSLCKKVTKEDLNKSRNNIIKNFSKSKMFEIYRNAYSKLNH